MGKIKKQNKNRVAQKKRSRQIVREGSPGARSETTGMGLGFVKRFISINPGLPSRTIARAVSSVILGFSTF